MAGESVAVAAGERAARHAPGSSRRRGGGAGGGATDRIEVGDGARGLGAVAAEACGGALARGALLRLRLGRHVVAHELLRADALDVLLRLELRFHVLVALEEAFEVELPLLLLLLAALRAPQRRQSVMEGWCSHVQARHGTKDKKGCEDKFAAGLRSPFARA